MRAPLPARRRRGGRRPSARRTAGPPPAPRSGRQAGCGGCHTLQAAGSSGQRRPEPRLPPPLERRRSQRRSPSGRRRACRRSDPRSRATDIQALAAWVSSVAGASGATCARHRQRGGDEWCERTRPRGVKRLQRDLAKLGFFHGPVTGFYGPLTTAAVKRFQRSAGLERRRRLGPAERRGAQAPPRV